MKKNDFFKDLKALTKDDLKRKASELGEELMKLRFKSASGQYEHAHRFHVLRRSIAQIQTLLRSQQAGL